ncbi:MAG: 4Fe-4S ferredoxin N-terminal domain-containing protein [Halodesulfurarchaeum sp.]
MTLFGPDADGWEEWAESVLAETEHDTELGKELARDAIKVTKGELSEEEFHERHHEDVLAEFGVDDRPTKPSESDE